MANYNTKAGNYLLKFKGSYNAYSSDDGFTHYIELMDESMTLQSLNYNQDTIAGYFQIPYTVKTKDGSLTLKSGYASIPVSYDPAGMTYSVGSEKTVTNMTGGTSPIFTIEFTCSEEDKDGCVLSFQPGIYIPTPDETAGTTQTYWGYTYLDTDRVVGYVLDSETEWYVTTDAKTFNISFGTHSIYEPHIVNVSADETNLVTIRFTPGESYDDVRNYSVTYGPSGERQAVYFSDSTEWESCGGGDYLFKFRPINPWKEDELQLYVSMWQNDPEGETGINEYVTVSVPYSPISLYSFTNGGGNDFGICLTDYSNLIKCGKANVILRYFDSNNILIYERNVGFTSETDLITGIYGLSEIDLICPTPTINIEVDDNDGNKSYGSTDYYCVYPTSIYIYMDHTDTGYKIKCLRTALDRTDDTVTYHLTKKCDYKLSLLDENYNQIISIEKEGYNSGIFANESVKAGNPHFSIELSEFGLADMDEMLKVRYVRIENLYIHGSKSYEYDGTLMGYDVVSGPFEYTLDYVNYDIFISKNPYTVDEDDNKISFHLTNVDNYAVSLVNSYYTIYDSNTNILKHVNIDSMENVETLVISENLDDYFDTDSISIKIYLESYDSIFNTTTTFAKTYTLPYVKQGIIVNVKIPEENKYVQGLLYVNSGTEWLEALEVHVKESDDATTYTQLA